MDSKKSFLGKVIKRDFGKSSKSEHIAVLLMTENKEFKLRRVGGNPFHDEILEEMVGLDVECLGKAVGSTLFFETWFELDQSSKQTDMMETKPQINKSKLAKKVCKKKAKNSKE